MGTLYTPGLMVKITENDITKDIIQCKYVINDQCRTPFDLAHFLLRLKVKSLVTIFTARTLHIFNIV